MKKILTNTAEGAILYIPKEGITVRLDPRETKKIF